MDTSPLVAAMIDTDDKHAVCATLIENLPRPLLVPALVVAEISHFLATRLPKPMNATAEMLFLRQITDGEIVIVDPENDWQRIYEVVHQYQGFPIGTTDASIVAAAERMNITQVATLDRRHFDSVVPRHAQSFAILPA